MGVSDRIAFQRACPEAPRSNSHPSAAGSLSSDYHEAPCVSISLAPFIHKPHPFHFWMVGWLQKLPLSTMRAEYLTMNTKYPGKTSTTFKSERPSNSHSIHTLSQNPLLFPLMNRSSRACMEGMSGEEVVNDLLRLGTKVSDWRRNSRRWGSVDDKVRLLRHSARLRWKEETDSVRENIMAEEFCFGCLPPFAFLSLPDVIPTRHVSLVLHLSPCCGSSPTCADLRLSRSPQSNQQEPVLLFRFELVSICPQLLCLMWKWTEALNEVWLLCGVLYGQQSLSVESKRSNCLKSWCWGRGEANVTKCVNSHVPKWNESCYFKIYLAVWSMNKLTGGWRGSGSLTLYIPTYFS